MTVEHDGPWPEERYRCVHYLRRVWLEDGGVVRVVLDICSLLAACGHHVTLLTTDVTDVPPTWRAGDKNLPMALPLPAPRLAGTPAIEADSALPHRQLRTLP